MYIIFTFPGHPEEGHRRGHRPQRGRVNQQHRKQKKMWRPWRNRLLKIMASLAQPQLKEKSKCNLCPYQETPTAQKRSFAGPPE